MIKIEHIERLLQCVVPAATVRMEGVASVVEQRAVPAEIAALEAALVFAKALSAACEKHDSLMSERADKMTEWLAWDLSFERVRAAIGGNEKLCHKAD